MQLTFQNLHRYGINMPNPLPDTEAIIARLQFFRDDRQYTLDHICKGDPENQGALLRNQTVIDQLDQMMADLRSGKLNPHAEDQPQPATDSPEKNILVAQNTPQPEIPSQPHQLPPDSASDSEVTQADSDVTQSRLKPDSTATQTDSKPSQADEDDPLNDLAIDLQTHLTGKSPLDKLSAEEQAAVLKLLEDHNTRDVAKLVALPRPCGLDFKTSQSSISRFYNRHKKRQAALLRQKKHTHAQDIAVKSGPDGFLKASVHMVEARLLEATSHEDTTPEDLQFLAKTIATLRRQSLAERQQTHREQQANYA